MSDASRLARFVATWRRAYSGLSREIWILAAVMLVNRAGTMVMPLLSLYYTQRLGFSKGDSGTLLLAYGVGAVAGAYFGGQLSDRWGPV
ncbi:MAG: MFS transporter, partial [Planctomycetes bacterium]|nr:MFS transporter [Planctomycetota bacterium]